ncbi:aspartate-semialdehyde dehydrogenase [Candidatus Woesearchaeota archaeon]|nr:aspartate-semialdehyde dehydrogenase [Candidatus Woesearchaeota archaeon]
MQKLKVGVLGATGMVGQRFVQLLEGHPWFEVAYVAASEASAGKSYAAAVEGRWHNATKIPELVGKLIVGNVADVDAALKSCSFVFSALETDAAKIFEEKYAEAGLPVVSNASAHRHTRDVPMVMPEINPEHLDIIPQQRKSRGWKKGFIVVKPNCSIQSYMAPLFALRKFGIKQVIVTTMQAISGAGHPGVASLDIIDNVIPLIKGEEEKTETEPLKIFGKVSGSEIVYDGSIKISAHCNRVPVIDGHMACVSVSFEKKPSRQQVMDAWKNFKAAPQELKLPMAPAQPIIYTDDAARPQTRLDRDNDKGMATTVGRLRDCNVLDYRFVGLSHNIIRGAAGGAILTAELLKAKGMLQ